MSQNDSDKMALLLKGLEALARQNIRAFKNYGTIPSENVLTPDMRLPFLGLRDGTTTYENQSRGTDRTMEVTFHIFTEIGSRKWLDALFSSGGNIGILELARLVEDTFIHANLKAGFSFLRVVSRSGSDFIDVLDERGQRTKSLQRLSITMEWNED